VTPKRQTHPRPRRSTARDGSDASHTRIARLERTVENLQALATVQANRLESLQAELDHCVARVTEFLGGRLR